MNFFYKFDIGVLFYEWRSKNERWKWQYKFVKNMSDFVLDDIFGKIA